MSNDEVKVRPGATPGSLKDSEPIFVVGAPRSGTTLLQLILDSHPDIAMNGEVHFFDQVLQLRAQIPDLCAAGAVEHFFAQLPRIDAFQYLPNLASQLGEVRARLASDARPTYERFFLYMLEAPALAAGAKRCGEKTPENIRYLPDLTRILPTAKIVHIVRDPRDVVSSLLKMPWAPQGVVANALKWKIDMLFMRDFKRDGGRVHELRYEDLLEHPEATLHALCEFIGVSWTHQMLQFHSIAHGRIKDEPWKRGTSRQLNESARGRWRQDLSAGQVNVVEFVVRPFLEDYGYHPAGTAVRRRIALPYDVGTDLWRYVRGRTAERSRRTREARDTIFGEERRLWSKLREALLTR